MNFDAYRAALSTDGLHGLLVGHKYDVWKGGMARNVTEIHTESCPEKEVGMYDL